MSSSAKMPEIEVVKKAKRRQFSASDKRRLLRLADACTERGDLGALLRREGIYSSQLSKWRQQAEQGKRSALAPRRRGPQARILDERDKEISALKRQIDQLVRRAERAEGLVEIQKKLSVLMGIELPAPKEETE